MPIHPTSDPHELPSGTLELLILRSVADESRHGYGISHHIKQRSSGALLVEEGSLYPALRRMETSGWIEAVWEVSPTNRRARYYSLTPAGRNQIRVERLRWRASAAAVARIMEMA